MSVTVNKMTGAHDSMTYSGMSKFYGHIYDS